MRGLDPQSGIDAALEPVVQDWQDAARSSVRRERLAPQCGPGRGEEVATLRRLRMKAGKRTVLSVPRLHRLWRGCDPAPRRVHERRPIDDVIDQSDLERLPRI